VLIHANTAVAARAGLTANIYKASDFSRFVVCAQRRPWLEVTD
jgi:hypothetical protein